MISLYSRLKNLNVLLLCSACLTVTTISAFFLTSALAMPGLQVKVPSGLAKVNQVRFSVQPGLAVSVDEHGSSIWNLQGMFQANYFPNANLLDMSSDGRLLVLSNRLPVDKTAEQKKQLENYKV